MIIFLTAALVAALIGLVRGGSARTLAETKFRALWLLFAGLGVQLAATIAAPSWLGGAPGTIVIVATNLAVAAFLWANRSLPGVVLILAGLALNIVVISANGAMPVSVAASRSAGLAPPPRVESDVEHERLGADARLPWLADVIALPHLGQVFSLGDVVLGLGVAELVYKRTTAGRRRHRAATGSAASD